MRPKRKVGGFANFVAKLDGKDVRNRPKLELDFNAIRCKKITLNLLLIAWRDVWQHSPRDVDPFTLNDALTWKTVSLEFDSICSNRDYTNPYFTAVMDTLLEAAEQGTPIGGHTINLDA